MPATRAVVLATLISAALTAIALAAPGVSRVVYPAQRLPLRFSHAQHVGALAMTCTQCHDRATPSRSATDRLIPGEAACRACHAIDRARPDGTGGGPASACVACHPGHVPGTPVARISIPTPHLKFSHAAHATTPCQHCHGDLAAEGVGLATRDHLPRMETCLGCHDGATADATCTTCHLATPGGRVRTELPDGRLVPAMGGVAGTPHDADFRTQHARAAQQEARACASCHEERFCADCHLGTVKPMDFHPGDYVTLHAVEARRGVPDCAACHTTQRFCVGCHERSGVGVRADSGFSRSGAIGRFHPPGWATLGSRGPDHHANEAQKNLKACTSCHREDFCRECHSAEPMRLGISPHGPGWRTSGRCRALAAKNQRMCLRCHTQLERVGCD
jgi:hypothetical protein